MKNSKNSVKNFLRSLKISILRNLGKTVLSSFTRKLKFEMEPEDITESGDIKQVLSHLHYTYFIASKCTA